MTFDAEERSVLAALADVLIPAGEDFPSASEAGVASEGLDQVLSARPDLGVGLKGILGRACGRSAEEVVAELQKRDPASFNVLAELIPAAYFLNAKVRAKLGYDGQSSRPIDARADYLEGG